MVLELFLWGAGKQRDRGARKWDGNMGWERASALQPSMRLQVRPRPHDGPVVHRSDRCGRLARFRRGPFETKAPCCKAPSKASALQYLHLHRPIKTASGHQIQCHARGAAGAAVRLPAAPALAPAAAAHSAAALDSGGGGGGGRGGGETCYV